MTLIDKVFASNKDLQVVLVPSLRDANHEMVYPQPPFDKKKVCEAFGSPEYAKVCQCMDVVYFLASIGIKVSCYCVYSAST